MAAFSFQPHHHHHPFIPDSAHLPVLQHQFEEMCNASSCFLYHHKPESIPDSPTTEPITYESNHPLLQGQMTDYSVSVKVEAQLQGSTEKKRKYRDGSCSTSAQSQETEDSKSKKQRKLKAVGMKETKACGEPPVGYIHVRARRGQATDSHSLAERARREKISERMKLLQSLVPGCNKVVGKALVLDEIINYVQCLQSQVEFLSMKLASVNPMSYHHFGVNQSEQGPIDFSQDNGALLMQVGDQRHEFLNQFLLNNMCSFQ